MKIYFPFLSTVHAFTTPPSPKLCMRVVNLNQTWTMLTDGLLNIIHLQMYTYSYEGGHSCCFGFSWLLQPWLQLKPATVPFLDTTLLLEGCSWLWYGEGSSLSHIPFSVTNGSLPRSSVPWRGGVKKKTFYLCSENLVDLPNKSTFLSRNRGLVPPRPTKPALLNKKGLVVGALNVLF